MRSEFANSSTRSETGLVLLLCGVLLLANVPARAFDIEVVEPDGSPVSDFRYLVEEDNTVFTTPGAPVSDSIGVNIHRSHAPVLMSGEIVGSTVNVPLPDTQRYFVSVLPLSGGTLTGHTLGGAPVAVGQQTVRVVVNPLPIPTSQISVYVFLDHNTINNAPDLGIETGLEGFKIIVEDAGGQVIQDAFGNTIGTEYLRNPDNSFQLDGDGMPIPDPMQIGDGFLYSDADGWAVFRYIPPGKYALIVSPPPGPNWIQTSTIEGTNVIDAWVTADGSRLFLEGFGAATAHTSFGFVNPDLLPWVGVGPGTGTIIGELRNNHFGRPPTLQGYHSGEPVPGCWVGLNDVAAQQGQILVECNSDSTFSIDGVPPGSYELVNFDENLDQLFGFGTVVVPPEGGVVDVGTVLSNRWFGTLMGHVFNDLDQDGFRDPAEGGLADQGVNLRFRDGRLYRATVSEPDGSYFLGEVFPFFKWLVAEVDFATRKATGATFAVDGGGAVPADDGWFTPSRGRLNPQEQPASNPHTGNNLSRTELGEVLTQAMMLFLGQTNVIDWGKANYTGTENGGISGVVLYATTRAEDDPRWAAAEDWEPGVPRVQLNLYEDKDGDGVIDDIDAVAGVTAADVDNHPLGWADGGLPGPEDVDHNSNDLFDPGDAINVTWTDSFDDDQPTGCIQELPTIHGEQAMECYDNFGTWNQLRAGVFDGGFAFTSYFPGGMGSGSMEQSPLPSGIYITEAAAPLGYEHVKEEDKNVDFGDVFTPSLKTLDDPPVEAIPVPCVGDLHLVPDYLTMFPDQQVSAGAAGLMRPLCDRKQVLLTAGSNPPAEFYLFTQVPKAARVVGFVNNDLAAEFNVLTPNFGEKAAPSWLPISFQDWTGNEITRIYTDEFGAYTGLLPSTYTMNAASPSGMVENMLTACLNHPHMADPNNPGQVIPDPYYDPDYSQSCWTLEYIPGGTTYLDTPIVPVGAFVGYPNRNLDLEPATMTPGINTVDGDLGNGGPAVCAADAQITITSVGMKQVPNPDFDPDVMGSQALVTRDYGFGLVQGQVTLDGVALPIVSWTDAEILASVPGGSSTGQLLVQRGDNLNWSETGITVHVGVCAATFVPTDFATIQAAIDAAAPGSLVIIEPGTYLESPILWKPLLLQGSGAESTTVFATPTPESVLQAWHEKALALYGSDPFAAQEAPGLMIFAGTGAVFDGTPARVDGILFTGSLSGGGVYVYDEVHNLEISNNVMRSNQGIMGGGLTIGDSQRTLSNTGIWAHHNRIVKNGGIRGGGGVSIFEGADGYQITDNFISGNLSRFYGAGVLHFGSSTGGLIARNQILFNEVFWGTNIGGDGGGIFVGSTIDLGDPAELADGTGDVTIDSNRIQGNLSGSGNGGGIAAARINGLDVQDLPQELWYRLEITNNIVSNNVAAKAGAGIWLQDVAAGAILHNTVANNDSTATAAAAFTPGMTQASNAQPAGIVSELHSVDLLGAFPAGLEQLYSDPVLANNIIWNNRSFFWDATLNNDKGGLTAGTPAIFDLAVMSSDPAHVLDPMNNVLTDPAGTHPSNVASDPEFVSSTVNDLATAAVIDEGGNFITTRFTPLTSAESDYTISGMSGAVGVADGSWIPLYPGIASDFQGDPRLATSLVEAGADELPIGDANCDGVLGVEDIGQIINVIFGGASVCGSEDFNLDGVVDAADLESAINALN